MQEVGGEITRNKCVYYRFQIISRCWTRQSKLIHYWQPGKNTTKKSLEIQAWSCDYFESCHTWFKIPDLDLPEDLKWYLLGWCFCHRASEPTLVPVLGHGGPWIKDINKAISFHHCFLCSIYSSSNEPSFHVLFWFAALNTTVSIYCYQILNCCHSRFD